MSLSYLGDLPVGSVVYDWFDSSDLGGGPVAVTGLAAHVLKNGSGTQITTGVTIAGGVDGVGINRVAVNLAADGSIFAAGSQFAIVVNGTIDGIAFNKVLATFSIGHRVNTLLDFVDAIESGLSIRQTMRAVAAMAAGLVSGMENRLPVFMAAKTSSKARITATCDKYGNRSAIVLDLD